MASEDAAFPNSRSGAKGLSKQEHVMIEAMKAFVARHPKAPEEWKDEDYHTVATQSKSMANALYYPF